MHVPRYNDKNPVAARFDIVWKDLHKKISNLKRATTVTIYFETAVSWLSEDKVFLTVSSIFAVKSSLWVKKIQYSMPVFLWIECIFIQLNLFRLTEHTYVRIFETFETTW